MPGLHAVALHSLRHHAPVILLTHRLLYRLGIVVELDAGVQYTGIGHIFLHMGIGGVVVSALVAPVVEICHGCLVHLVVSIKPSNQHLHRRVGVQGFEFLLIGIGQTADCDERVVICGASSTTHYIYATACRELLVVGNGHNASVHKFPHRDAKSVIVVLHNSASLILMHLQTSG